MKKEKIYHMLTEDEYNQLKKLDIFKSNREKYEDDRYYNTKWAIDHLYELYEYDDLPAEDRVRLTNIITLLEEFQ